MTPRRICGSSDSPVSSPAGPAGRLVVGHAHSETVAWTPSRSASPARSAGTRRRLPRTAGRRRLRRATSRRRRRRPREGRRRIRPEPGELRHLRGVVDHDRPRAGSWFPGTLQARVEPAAVGAIPKPRTRLPDVVPIRTGADPSVNHTAAAPAGRPDTACVPDRGLAGDEDGAVVGGVHVVDELPPAPAPLPGLLPDVDGPVAPVDGRAHGVGQQPVRRPGLARGQGRVLSSGGVGPAPRVGRRVAGAGATKQGGVPPRPRHGSSDRWRPPRTRRRRIRASPAATRAATSSVRRRDRRGAGSRGREARRS